MPFTDIFSIFIRRLMGAADPVFHPKHKINTFLLLYWEEQPLWIVHHLVSLHISVHNVFFYEYSQLLFNYSWCFFSQVHISPKRMRSAGVSTFTLLSMKSWHPVSFCIFNPELENHLLCIEGLKSPFSPTVAFHKEEPLQKPYSFYLFILSV